MDAPSAHNTKPLLIFDGDCSFCRAWVHYWQQRTGDAVEYETYQQAAARYPEIAREEFQRAVQLVLPDGSRRSGAYAAFTSLAQGPNSGWLLNAYEKIPGFASITEWSYRYIARHRDLGFWITKILWGAPVETSQQVLVGSIFLRILGLIYLIAFASFGAQADGLIGSRGILPIAEVLPWLQMHYGAARFFVLPTLFWLSASDAYIRTVWMVGMLLSLLMVLGIGKRSVRFGCYVLYLSLVAAGQIFMGYQWDALLLEAGCLAIFLGSTSCIRWLYRWLLFRLMFMSGMVKVLSHDPTWRDLTAMSFHYHTQPIPNLIAWYADKLPLWVQKSSTGGTLGIELAVPFLFFMPRRPRALAAVLITGLQILILLTGNFAFFNLLALALCLFLIDDRFLRKLIPAWALSWLPPEQSESEGNMTGAGRILGWSLTIILLTVSLSGLSATILGTEPALLRELRARSAPFEIVNEYGLFAVMTTERPEIIFEGSQDGQSWKEYSFRYKAGDIHRRPPWVAPHQPRLDWQLWFASLGDLRSDPWVINFTYRLLQNSPAVLRLMDENPFPERPPRYVRAVVYDYRFTTFAEKRTTGAWWHREERGVYLPPVSLENFRQTPE